MEAEFKGRDIDRGWAWVVMGATYLGLMMFSTSYFMVGVVYVELLERYRDDEVKTSLVGTLNMAIYALLAPFASAVASRYTCRTSVMVGGLLMATSGVLSSFVDSVGMLILTYGVFGGLLTGGPNGIMASIALSILGLQKLAAAHGLEYFFCGLGFGGGPPIASALYSHSGSYGTSFIVAGSSVILGSALALIAYLRSRNKEGADSEATELQINTTKDSMCKSSEQNKRNNLDDPLLNTSASRNDVHVLTNVLRPDIEDILTLAGSSHSLTI